MFECELYLRGPKSDAVQNLLKLWTQAEKMSQLVKFLCKNEDLSSDPHLGRDGHTKRQVWEWPASLNQ